MPIYKHVSEKNDMCKLLGAEKDPDSVLVRPNFKEIIFFFIMLRYSTYLNGKACKQTDVQKHASGQ